MKNYSAKEIKNIVLIGAPGTGKTTLAEAMAFEGKVIDRRGSIETNNTLSDNTDIEHEYKRSIYSTILFTEFMDRKLNIIDCPGSDDFCGSLFSAFKVGDVGVFLFNAQNGWEVGSEIQARYAFKEAFRNAGPKIMEPIYSVEVLVPSEYMGAVMSDLQNRRAMIAGMESDKGFDRLNALVPLAELYRYSTTLSSLTSGSATYTMKFGSYEQVPADVQEKLLKAYTDTDDE